MPLTGTITVSTCGYQVGFSTANTNFRAHFVMLQNISTTGAVWVDITSTSANTTGFQINSGTAPVVFGPLNGTPGFSAIASTAGGTVSVSYVGVR